MFKEDISFPEYRLILEVINEMDDSIEGVRIQINKYFKLLSKSFDNLFNTINSDIVESRESKLAFANVRKKLGELSGILEMHSERINEDIQYIKEVETTDYEDIERSVLERL